MKNEEPKKLIRENKWWRVYEIGSVREVHESKLRGSAQSISLADLEKHWQSWSSDERLDFANAFVDAADEGPEIERIFEFLMQNGDEYCCANIALSVTTLKNRPLALRWLTEHMQTGSAGQVNYITALNILGDPAAVPDLRKIHQHLVGNLAYLDDDQIGEILACYAALVKLEGVQLYMSELKSLLGHKSELIRRGATAILQAHGVLGFYV